MKTKKKPSKSEKIEADNLLEEALAIFDECISCGMCKTICPTFKAIKEERLSARGQGVLLSQKITNNVFFECTLCRGCDQNCPVGLKIYDAILKARQAMVLRGKGLKSNEEMIENIRKTGNPFTNCENKK